MSKNEIPSFLLLDPTSGLDDNLHSRLNEVGDGVTNPPLEQEPEAPLRSTPPPPPASFTVPHPVVHAATHEALCDLGRPLLPSCGSSNGMKWQRCIPFANLRFLRNVSTKEPLLLSPVEKVFWDTYKVLATSLIDVKDIRDLPAAFERAVVVSLALRLLALNRNAASPEVSASLGELLPEAQFKNNGTKLLQLRRRVCGDAFALQQFSGTGAKKPT